jgi:PhnB protein
MTRKVTAVPEGFRSITPYLVVLGVPALLDFLRDAFCAEELIRAPDPQGRIVHAAVRLGDSVVEMGDVGGTPMAPLPGSLHFYVKAVDAVYRQAVQAGAKSLYEPREMEYGDREGGVQDCAGNNWFLATHKSGQGYRPPNLNDVTPRLRLNNASAFITFAETVFAAVAPTKHADSAGVVGHAKLRIGDSVIELSEARDEWRPWSVVLHHYSDRCDVIFRQGLAAGATELLPMKDQPYGDRAGGLLDAWGNHWYIATRTEDLSLGEIKARDASGQREN